MTFLTVILAATIYCGPSSSGNGSGSDFNNRAALPNTTSFTRGDVYVVIEGSYGNKTLSTAASGSSTITIRKASASLDSGVSGYSSSLHDGQSVFGDITVHTPRWILNGMTREETNAWAAPSGYGFRATSIGADSVTNSDDADFSEFHYIEVGGSWNTNPSSGTIATYGPPLRFVYNHQGLVFSRLSIHNGNAALFMAHGTDGAIVEYCHFAYGWGKEAIAAPNVGADNLVVRYCRFLNSARKDPGDPSGGLTAEIGIFGVDVDPTGVQIYGNWFSSDVTDSGRNTVIFLGGYDGTDTAFNCKIFNNTFAGIDDECVFNAVFVSGGSGNEVRNNLFYDCASTGITANTSSNNVVAGSDPFVNYGTLDLRLAGATAAGATLSSTYNSDPLGSTRGSDGTWDVGAYEYAAGGGGGATIQTLNVQNLTITGP